MKKMIIFGFVIFLLFANILLASAQQTTGKFTITEEEAAKYPSNEPALSPEGQAQEIEEDTGIVEVVKDFFSKVADFFGF